MIGESIYNWLGLITLIFDFIHCHLLLQYHDFMCTIKFIGATLRHLENFENCPHTSIFFFD